MTSPTRSVFFLLGCSLLLAAAPVVCAKPAEEERADVRRMRNEVLTEFYAGRPELKTRVRDAVGYAVFSNVGVNILFASFAGGHGIVVTRGMFKDDETFMKMGSAGIGLGLGVKDFRVLFIFTDRKKLEDFIAKGWDFSGQADAAAKSDKKGDAVTGAGSLLPGVDIYQITKNGIVLQATLQGTKYWKDGELNDPAAR
jgi:lipid-binding SYLF domain-containing protein